MPRPSRVRRSPRGSRRRAASLFVPVTLEPGASRTIRVKLAWYVPLSHLRSGKDPAGAATDPDKGYFRAWYAGRFASLGALVAHWRTEYDALRARALRFSECFHDTTLPPEVIEAVAANLSILKSPTVLRQDDGRLWAWEGCGDASGCCHGTCTHVWNYAQAMPHLFPSLERTLRETEFGPSQADTGHQMFRAALPIRPLEHDFHAAADGQLGGIMKVHRDWRISGDTEWLRALWPKVTKSLDYCIATWDPRLQGRARGAAPQHLRHRVLGPERHVHQLLSRCAAGGGADGRGARRRRRALSRAAGEGHGVRRDRISTTASTSSRRSSGRA